MLCEPSKSNKKLQHKPNTILMRVVIRVLLVLIFLGVFGWTLYFLYSKNQEEPTRFLTEQAFVTDIYKKTVATGKVVPRKEIAIKPQVSGIIEKIFVEPGDQVKKGDLIARVSIVPNMVNLNNAENRVRLAEINLRSAQQDFDRNKPLLDEGVIPTATFQQFEIAFANAKQELAAAKDNLEIIRKGSTSRSGKTANTLVRSTPQAWSWMYQWRRETQSLKPIPSTKVRPSPWWPTWMISSLRGRWMSRR
jgi:HlyD family secretion protein